MERQYKSGVKHDLGKDQWHLLPLWVLRPVVRVLMVGAKKYAAFNWQKVVNDDPQRYYDACQRHLSDWQKGERIEPESGQPTLAHAICCLIFLLWNQLYASKR